MTTYRLYLESGPQHKKTLVYTLDLPGCVANGRTTESAVAATPDAIRDYLRFLKRHGDRVSPEAPFEVVVAEHITEGEWLGNGSPTVIYQPDFQPVTEAEIEMYLRRFHWLREELIAWASARTDEYLDAHPTGGGRTGRAVLLHVLAPVGGYLSAALGAATGFSAVAGAAERGEIGVVEALERIEEMAADVVRATTPEQRAFVRVRPKDTRTLRKALRRMLEHDWEHFQELSAR